MESEFEKSEGERERERDTDEWIEREIGESRLTNEDKERMERDGHARREKERQKHSG